MLHTKKTQTGEEEESQTPATETQHQPDPESQPLSTDGQTTTAAQPTTQQSAGASTSAAAASTSAATTEPQANFDSTYMKQNQCVCGFEAKDQHDLRVHKGTSTRKNRIGVGASYKIPKARNAGVHLTLMTRESCGGTIGLNIFDFSTESAMFRGAQVVGIVAHTGQMQSCRSRSTWLRCMAAKQR